MFNVQNNPVDAHWINPSDQMILFSYEMKIFRAGSNEHGVNFSFSTKIFLLAKTAFFMYNGNKK